MPFAAVSKHSAGGASSELRRRRKTVATDASHIKIGGHHGDGLYHHIDKNATVPAMKEEDLSASSRSCEEAIGDVDAIRAAKAVETKKKITVVDTEKKIATAIREEDDSSIDDVSSVSSLESLLSSRSDDGDEWIQKTDDDHENDENLHGLERLEKELQLRKKMLTRVCAGKPATYVQLLTTNEEKVASLKREQYFKKHTCKKSSKASRSNTVPQREIPTQRLLHMWRWLVFEYHHAVPASVKLVIICSCHLLFHGTFDTATRILYHNVFLNVMSQECFCLCQVLVGLCLLRANGYLWMFLEEEDYNAVKFDMHNRRHLESWDSKLLLFFKTTVFGSAANLFGFYFVYNGLNNLATMSFNKILTSMEAWYLATKTALLKEQDFDEGALKFYSWEGTSPGYSEEEHNTCKFLKHYVHPPHLQWLFQYCCSDPFMEWKLVEISCYGVLLLAATILAHNVGVNLLEICDEE